MNGDIHTAVNLFRLLTSMDGQSGKSWMFERQILLFSKAFILNLTYWLTVQHALFMIIVAFKIGHLNNPNRIFIRSMLSLQIRSPRYFLRKYAACIHEKIYSSNKVSF